MSEVSFGPGTCPRCRSFDLVQRVAGIVASQQNGLSWALTPPARPGTPLGRPARRRGMRWGWLLLLLVLLPLDIVALLIVLVLVAALVAVLVGVALAALTAFAVYYLATYGWRQARRAEGRRQLEARQAAHDHALTYWQQLCHCYRCHGVFLPDNEWQRAVVPAGDVTPPEGAWELCTRLAEYAARWHAPAVLGESEAPLAPAPDAGP